MLRAPFKVFSTSLILLPSCSNLSLLIWRSKLSLTSFWSTWSLASPLPSSTFKGDHCRQCFDRLGNPAQLEISSFMPFAINSMKFRPAALSGRVIPLQQISLLSAISIEYRLCDTHSAAVPHDLHHKPKCYP